MTAPSEVRRATFWSSFDQINHFLNVWGLIIFYYLYHSQSLGRRFFIFFMLHRLSGTVSLAKLDHQTHIFQNIFEISPLYAVLLTLFVCLSVCLSVSLFVRARSQKFNCVLVLCNGLCALIWRNSPPKSTLLSLFFAKGRFLTRVSSMANQSPWIRCYSVSSWILMTHQPPRDENESHIQKSFTPVQITSQQITAASCTTSQQT